MATANYSPHRYRPGDRCYRSSSSNTSSSSNGSAPQTPPNVHPSIAQLHKSDSDNPIDKVINSWLDDVDASYLEAEQSFQHRKDKYHVEISYNLPPDICNEIHQELHLAIGSLSIWSVLEDVPNRVSLPLVGFDFFKCKEVLMLTFL
jgi:hypothetical protein